MSERTLYRHDCGGEEMSLKSVFARQYLPKTLTAQLIGGGYAQWQRTMFYWSGMNGLIVLVLGWDSSIGGFLRSSFPWISFGWLVCFAIVGLLVVNTLDYLLVVPSVYAFSNRQTAMHDSPAMKLLYEIQAEQKEQSKRLGEIEAGLAK